MFVKRFFEPTLAQTSYLIGCAAAREAIVIDPNRDAEQYIAGGRRPKARGSRTSPRRTSTRISCPAAASWRRGPARRCTCRTKATRPGSTPLPASRACSSIKHGDRITVGNIVDRRGAHAGTHAGAPDVSRHRRRRRRTSRSRAATGDFVFVGDVGRPDLLERAANDHGHDGERARGRCTRACSSSRRGRTGCRSGRATAPDRRAARASARSRTARSATRSASTGRFSADDEDDVRAQRARRPAGAADVLRRDEAAEPGGADACSAASRGRRRSIRDALDARARRRRRSSSTRGRRSTSPSGHVPGTINIPLNGSFTTWAGWLRAVHRGLLADRRRPRRRGAVDAAVRRSRDDRPRSRSPATSTRASSTTWTAAGRAARHDPADPRRRSRESLRARRRHARRRPQPTPNGRAGHIPGATAHPARLSRRIALREVPRAKPVVVQCAGRRAVGDRRQPASRRTASTASSICRRHRRWRKAGCR